MKYYGDRKDCHIGSLTPATVAEISRAWKEPPNLPFPTFTEAMRNGRHMIGGNNQVRRSLRVAGVPQRENFKNDSLVAFPSKDTTHLLCRA